MLNLDKDDELLILRSAEIGDFLVILPFINYLINIVGIPRKKIHFVIFNNHNINPLELIFGEGDCLIKNSLVLNVRIGHGAVSRARSHFAERNFTKIIYLPFFRESLKSKIKKYIFIKLISFGKKNIYGLNFRNKSKNVTTQYLTYFEQLGLKNFKSYLNFNISDITNFSESEVSSISAIDLKQKNIALYINSKLTMKIWDQLNFFKIIEYINNNYHDVNIYLIGGLDDVEYNNKFISKFNLRYVKNIAGHFSIRENMLLFNKFELLIGNDGSPLHMAAYSNCAILGIYTYKEEILTWEPYFSSKFITVRKNTSCKHCYLKFCPDPVCISGIGYEEVLDYVNILLSDKPARSSVTLL